jgi:hypothetical protein
MRFERDTRHDTYEVADAEAVSFLNCDNEYVGPSWEAKDEWLREQTGIESASVKEFTADVDGGDGRIVVEIDYWYINDG